MSPRDCQDVGHLVPGDVWKGETAVVFEAPCLTNLVLVAEVAGRKRLETIERDRKAAMERLRVGY